MPKDLPRQDIFELDLPTFEEEDFLSKEAEERVREWLRKTPVISMDGAAFWREQDCNKKKVNKNFMQSLSFLSTSSTDHHCNTEDPHSDTGKPATHCFACIVLFLRKA